MSLLSSFGKARRDARPGWPGKRRNAADGLSKLTLRAGQFLPLALLWSAYGTPHHRADHASPETKIVLVK